MAARSASCRKGCGRPLGEFLGLRLVRGICTGGSRPTGARPHRRVSPCTRSAGRRQACLPDRQGGHGQVDVDPPVHGEDGPGGGRRRADGHRGAQRRRLHDPPAVRLPHTTTLNDVRGGAYRPGRFTKTLASLDTLIVDEASMVRADVFDMVAAALSRFGPQPGTPFGGVQIVLVGDLYQLPPVVSEGETEFFSTTYETPYFFSANSFVRDEFPTVALTTVFRQLGDDRMTAILNEIREGVLLGHAHEQLNARTNPDFVPPEDEFWMTLAPTNRLVTARNRQQLERLPGDELIHHARASGDLSLFDPPVEETLRFKVGAQIMMLNNDRGNRWVNGTIGRVIGVA